MTDNVLEVPVVCDVCDTTTRVPLSDLPEAVQRHNDQQHDGDDIAQVDPEIVQHVTDLAAKDIGVAEDEA
ncbi:hypothetical protein C440_13909 [Haloferax mucosum ATCC BAA-1512]|uniref:DUF8149 domain-containing protein n=1 Tax=Haloferax mucosum ATCC BAA-1512 TaxID=662479 RepID=M0I7J3_9EURY|nr:hypothetical protein [Haloferax mucosum]ELZ91414.1 hypothetical protein C440_13909 [Haloferax mucosum ATCC BAA-1512]